MAVKVRVSPLHISALLLVILGVYRGSTVKVLSLVVAGQPPFAGMVYLTVTVVFAVTFAGV